MFIDGYLNEDIPRDIVDLFDEIYITIQIRRLGKKDLTTTNESNILLKINKRYENNKEILKVLEEYIEKNKDIRFIQALMNLNIIEADKFYEESIDTLKRIKNV